MVGVALLYARAYDLFMPTTSLDIRPAHRIAVRYSTELVDTVNPAQLELPTPCADWTLADLLVHMVAQHHGFAAAARGFGADHEVWRTDTVLDAVLADPGGTYSRAARDVLDAFADDHALDTPFALPDFGPDAVVPGRMAMGFHFVDYVVHGWDVAATIGVPFELPADVIAAVLPLALGVPDGDFRGAAGSPFAPTVSTATDDPEDAGLNRILAHLGRRPDWTTLERNQPNSTVTGAWSDQRKA
jgi:uncharacterized protein (TIGR03086 family)